MPTFQLIYILEGVLWDDVAISHGGQKTNNIVHSINIPVYFI
jgi:hypothetical protein